MDTTDRQVGYAYVIARSSSNADDLISRIEAKFVYFVIFVGTDWVLLNRAEMQLLTFQTFTSTSVYAGISRVYGI